MKLKNYREKRNFKESPEPSPSVKTKTSSKRPVFVVHEHHASHLHYDLRLEAGGTLKSWAVPKGPPLTPDIKRLAVMVEDHPLSYAAFKGTIPEGNYGAGEVKIWDNGTYDSIDNYVDARKAVLDGIKNGKFHIKLDGNKLKGEFALVKIRGKTGNNWLMFKKKIEEHDTVSAQDGEKSQMPGSVKPMLANSVEKPFNSEDWAFEIKLDGFRTIAQISKSKIKLYSRNNKPLNERFYPIAEALENISGEMIIDGEVVVIDEAGKPSFQLLQNYTTDKKGLLVYYVFDILYNNGYNLMGLPFTSRREILEKSILPSRHIRISEYISAKGVDFFNSVKQNNLEGVIAKRCESIYQPGKRSSDWLKIKVFNTQEAVICGFTQPGNSRERFGSLVLGMYENNELVFIGHVGGGFDSQKLNDIYKVLKPLITKKSPFRKVPKTNAPVTWVKPVLVCEVKFAEWTGDGELRQPVFIGLRNDKSPGEVKKEKLIQPEPDGNSKEEIAVINSRQVGLTHLGKIFWPKEKYTKGDLINYYRTVAPFILPYLKGRPQSLNRHPDGIKGQNFFHKNIGGQVPEWIKTFNYKKKSDEISYMVCNDEASLVYMVNLGCIEINPWHSTVAHPDNPDYALLDFDPLDSSFDKVVEAVLETHKLLDSIGAENFCKTSGATGMHIFIPLKAKYSYEQAKEFSRLVNTIVNSRLPGITSIERLPEKRHKSVYLDFLQNSIGQTVAAPYCVRPREGAPVSTPLLWKEVSSGLNPLDYNMKNTLKRLEKIGDPWKNMLSTGIDMKACLAKIDKQFKIRK